MISEAVNNGIKLVQSLFDYWTKTQPKRERKHDQKEAIDDTEFLSHNLAGGDALSVAEYFEAERVAGLLNSPPVQLHDSSQSNPIQQNPDSKS